MGKIDFVKYTSYGNNFVLIDEINKKYLSENEKSAFAYPATNMNFGVGSDNFLVIQRYTPAALKDINDTRHYWDGIPDQHAADYIFRMFEPDGTEAFCCANGLMCIASYLHQSHNVAVANILTEVPTANPETITMGTDNVSGQSWINLGKPRKVPEGMVNSEYTRPYDSIIDVLPNIEITFREHDLLPFSHKQSLNLQAYLIYTGEPHLVVFTHHGWSIEKLAELLFLAGRRPHRVSDKAEKRVNFGTWLIKHIGFSLNKKFKHIFPAGINVNFVKVNQRDKVLEYRTFERNLKETLSCGTGALAAAYITKELKLISQNEMVLWPHRCRWDDPNAEITVKEKEDGWLLGANPVRLFEGRYNYGITAFEKAPRSGVKSVAACGTQGEITKIIPERYTPGIAGNISSESFS